MPALSSPGEMLQTGVVACRDDKNQIGIFGCDKRSKPNCCLRCLAGSFIVTNHEGLSVLAVIGWISWFVPPVVGHFLFGCYVWCCYEPPLLGVHYGKKQYHVVGGPVAAYPSHAGGGGGYPCFFSCSSSASASGANAGRSLAAGGGGGSRNRTPRTLDGAVPSNSRAANVQYPTRRGGGNGNGCPHAGSKTRPDHRPRGGGTDCNLFATTSASYECATAAWPYHTSKTLDFGTEDDEFEDDEYDYSSDDELIP